MSKIPLKNALILVCLAAMLLAWAFPVAAQEATPTPEALDQRPVERNPYLVSGGVLIFVVIVFALLRYSRPKLPQE
jgi:hypothetical protein